MKLRTAVEVVVGLVLLGLVGKFWLDARAARNNPLVQADTVYLSKLPPGVKKEQQDLRKPSPSLREKLTGTKVIKPGEGQGPVIVYKEPIKVDTCAASAVIDEGKLKLTLQVPDSAGAAHLVQLPSKDVKDCRDVKIGSNGVVRCSRFPLGSFGIDLHAYTPVDSLGPNLDATLYWKHSKTARWGVTVSDKLLENPSRIYVGIRLSLQHD